METVELFKEPKQTRSSSELRHKMTEETYDTTMNELLADRDSLNEPETELCEELIEGPTRQKIWLHGTDWVDDEISWRDIRAVNRYITPRANEPEYIRKHIAAGPGLQIRPHQGEADDEAKIIIGAGRELKKLIERVYDQKYWETQSVRMIVGACVWEGNNRIRIEGAIDLEDAEMTPCGLALHKIGIWPNSVISHNHHHHFVRAVVWLRWDMGGLVDGAEFNQVVGECFVGRTLRIRVNPRQSSEGHAYLSFELQSHHDDLETVRKIALAVWRKAQRSARNYDLYKRRDPSYPDPLCRKNNSSLPLLRKCLDKRDTSSMATLKRWFPNTMPMIQCMAAWSKATKLSRSRYFQEKLRDLITIEKAMSSMVLKTRAEETLAVAKQTAPSTEESAELATATAPDLE